MTESEAKDTVNRMMELWTKWEPTVEQIGIWIDTLKRAGQDSAWKALRAAYSQHGRWNTPNPKDYHEQLILLHGPANQGVHASEDGPQLCPLYLEQIESVSKRPLGAMPLRSTWAFPHGLPSEEEMLRVAEKEWDEMNRLLRGRWVIKDARLTGAMFCAFKCVA